MALRLAQDSARAIQWLPEDCGVDLSVVARLGGHSFARTHHSSGALPSGFAIVSTLQKKVQLSDKVQVFTLTRFVDFIRNDETVLGITAQNETDSKKMSLFAKNIVFTTGGICADLQGPDSMIRRFRPDLLDFPQTNSPLTTGDG